MQLLWKLVIIAILTRICWLVLKKSDYNVVIWAELIYLSFNVASLLLLVCIQTLYSRRYSSYGSLTSFLEESRSGGDSRFGSMTYSCTRLYILISIRNVYSCWDLLFRISFGIKLLVNYSSKNFDFLSNAFLIKATDKRWDNIKKTLAPNLPVENMTLCHASMNFLTSKLNVEKFLELCGCVIWGCDRMANCSRIAVDLIVVATLICPVAKEVDCSVINPTGELGFVLEMLQAICLIPTSREDIEGYLTTNWVSAVSISPIWSVLVCNNTNYSRQAQTRELLLQCSYERLPNLVLLIIPFKLISLLYTYISANRTNIHHAIPELHKRAPLYRDIQVCNIMQNKLYQLLVLRLS